MTIQEPQRACNESTERIIWCYFIDKGYSEVQTAGILGNLRQEHNYKTGDASGGLGIAQWLNNRAEGLEQRGSHHDLQVQLDYIIYELNSYESEANTLLKQSTTIEEATIAFQDKFERCNPIYCMQQQRINYAYQVYNSNKE